MATDHRPTRHCLTLFARFSEWIDAEMDDPTRRRMERHIADCPACQVCLETLNRTVAVCRELDKSALPEGTVRKIMEKMRGEKRGLG